MEETKLTIDPEGSEEHTNGKLLMTSERRTDSVRLRSSANVLFLSLVQLYSPGYNLPPQ